jgi:cytochrome d ubiquinol oxidase subunit I
VASLILTHDADGEIKGLNEFVGKHPPVKPVFYSFRVMVGLGLFMILVAWVTRITLFKRNELPPWMLKVLVAMSFSGWIATLAGWYVTEIGRQPYIVSGVLTAKEAATDIAPENVALSLALYSIVYFGLLCAYLHTIFVMARRAIEIEEISDKENQADNILLNSTVTKNLDNKVENTDV